MRCSPTVTPRDRAHLAVGLEVGLDVVDGRRRRQTADEHLLGPRHHLSPAHGSRQQSNRRQQTSPQPARNARCIYLLIYITNSKILLGESMRSFRPLQLKIHMTHVCKNDAIHKTGSTQQVAVPPSEEVRATAQKIW